MTGVLSRFLFVALASTAITAAQPPPPSPRDSCLVDLDGDGDLDVATANVGSNNLQLRTNSGAGVLAVGTTVALTAADLSPVAIARGDLDNDGAADDLAVACSGSHTVVLVINPS